MIKSPSLILLCVVSALHALAQADTAFKDTTTTTLHEFIFTAYGQNTSALKTAASVQLITTADLDQYNNTSLLPAVNKTPGIRMEERSPGSYRFSIRGSSLESTFGVRNIKIYYNDIPYTDPGGNTYLNQIGFYNVQSLEIIKGPGSSLYGAGTGGVLLINSMPARWQSGASVSYTAGSYGLNSSEAEVRVGDSSFQNVIRYQHLQSDGYRQQSSTNKDVLSWDAVMKQNSKTEIDAHFFYGNLDYQTPGALTLAQYQADPQLARPTAAGVPGAIDSKAEIYQKTFLAGFTVKKQLDKSWSNVTTLYGDYSTQLNPNLRNYSRTSEPNFGGRTQFKYDHDFNNSHLQWITGAEAQQGFTDDRTYQNVNGTPQNLQADQEINNRLISGFTQLSYQLHRWIVKAGASINQLNVQLNTLSTSPYVSQDRTFSNQVAPRIAILRRITDNISVYGTAEEGFSPPTTSELAPTGSAVNFDLNAEHAWNYEVGTHSYVGKKLYVDASVFYLQLQNAIVTRHDSAAGDYYVNAGSTKQAGLELYLDYKLLEHRVGFLTACDIYASYTYNSFHYDQFIQESTDYSGKQMPGIAPNTVAAGISLHSKPGIYLNINYFYSDKMAMNDANTAYANAYNLLTAKLGYTRTFSKYSINIFAGADNILNQTYSLGNDINAVNGKYYNAAAPVNYYAGVSLGWVK